MMKNKKIYKTLPVTMRKGHEEGSALIVFATLGVIDKDNDVIVAGAFGEQLAAILPSHDWGSAPLGKARVFEDGPEALAELMFNQDIELARDWHSAMLFDFKDGEPIQEFSFGFTIL